MKKYNPLYYLLFILLVMGSFASMAQNSYGLKIIGGVAFAFGLLFLVQLIQIFRRKEKQDDIAIAELSGLFLLSIILGLRVFYIHFPFVEWLFTTAGILLILVYLRKMIARFRELHPKNNTLALLLLAFHLSLVLFIISLVMTPFAPVISTAAGVAAFILLLGFIVMGYVKKELMVEGEEVSAFLAVRKFKDHSILIVTLFSLFSLYVGFNKVGLVPGVYSDEFPQSYYKLVEEAASGKEKQVNGKYRHEEFKDKYDEFLKRNGITSK
jgi:hypothetical protein